MYLLTPIDGWPQVLEHAPDGFLVKAHDARLLREAKLAWIALGRDPAQLVTVYRHYDVFTAPEGDWPSAVMHWQRMFARWVDATYLKEYALYVDVVSESNEYTAESTFKSPVETAKAMQNMRAAAYVWNTFYRGRAVHLANGASGFIPARTRLALLAGPVANRFPVEVMRLAIDEDCVLDYHAYSLWIDGQRYERDFAEHSGLWNTLEDEYNLYGVTWLFGECGPYRTTEFGWRHVSVCDGRVELLLRAMGQWASDVVRTRAFREGRVLGTGAWFASGNEPQWEYYQLRTPELIAVADTINTLWGEPMDTSGVVAHLREMADALERTGVVEPYHLQHYPAGTNQQVFNAVANLIPAMDPALVKRMGERRGERYSDVAVERWGMNEMQTVEAVARLRARGLL